ncbi:MAG: hypothetical protein JW953_12735 [Anaerolineae bacterium]|nr:hypothetical protein [Anaerolineae bacterium]
MTLKAPTPATAQHSTASAQTEAAQNWLLRAVQGWGLILLTLHLAASRLPVETTWSVWPYTFLPSWLGWGLALLAGALIIPPINNTVLHWLGRLWRIWPGKHRRQWWFALAAGLAGLLFWLARLRHLRWGDAAVLAQALSHPNLELRVVYNWQAPLTVFLHQRLWYFVARPWLGWPVEYVYAAISIICGIGFVYLLLTFLAQLGRTPLESAVLAGLLLTTGSMQLFFGYVENYTIVSLGLLLTLFLAWRALRGDLQPVWPVLALALSNGFHPSTVFLWPGMLVLIWLCWKRNYVSVAGGLAQTILPPLLVGAGVFALMESGGHGLSALLSDDRPGGGDGIWFVPLFATTTVWQHYTMFSVAHLLDWLNEHLLISPFGLPLIMLTLITVSRFRVAVFDRPADKDYGYFLSVTAALYLLLTWVWNPDYGGRQDWDLFAPSAFVYTLLAGYLWVRVLVNRDKLKEGSLFIMAVAFLHAAAWIFTNTQDLPRENGTNR